LLKEGREEVLGRFVARARGLHDPAANSRALLLDGLPAFLDDIVRDLGHEPPPEVEEESAWGSAGTGHGEHRFDLGVDIVTMEREWAVLRDVILELLIEDGGSLSDFSRCRVR
jgi:hypothetical protein